jgi:MoaA/NifB/PqqE/SkfB family radical SAM enzyme
MLSFEHFKRYLEPFAPYLFEAYMHNWGESLLNKQVYRMIDYAQSQNVGTNLSSNFVDIDADDIDNLLDCGLEYLVVSLDGTSQETYGQYRIRGNYERVVANLVELIRRRHARKKTTPVIEWQFIVMKQNEHQIPEAEALAKKIGVDLLRFLPVGMPFELKNRQEIADKWYPITVAGRVKGNPEGLQFGQGSKPGPCFYLYRSMVVNPDGGISPCCVVYRKDRDFADLNGPEIDVMALWNNEKYRSARALFSPGVVPDRRATVCDGCDLFERHQSKKTSRVHIEPQKRSGPPYETS